MSRAPTQTCLLTQRCYVLCITLPKITYLLSCILLFIYCIYGLTLGLAHSLELLFPAKDQAKRNKRNLNVSVKENRKAKGMKVMKAKVRTLCGHSASTASMIQRSKCSAFVVICSPKASSDSFCLSCVPTKPFVYVCVALCSIVLIRFFPSLLFSCTALDSHLWFRLGAKT